MTTKILGTQIQDGTIDTAQLAANVTAAFANSSQLSGLATIANVANFATSLGPRIQSVNVANSSFVVSGNTTVNVGGGYVVVTGNNFATGATVIVDTTPASSVSRIDNTRLNVQVPARNAATYNLFVVNPDGGTGISVNAVTYLFTRKMYSLSGSSNPVNSQIGTDINWNKISSGSLSSDAVQAATKTDGTLWTWGGGGFGELGHNNLSDLTTPTKVGVLTDWSIPATTTNNTGAIKTNGTLWMWGWSNNGQLGLNDRISRSSPVQVGTLTDWSQLSIYFDWCAAIKTDNTLWTWGRSDDGQLGFNDRINRSSPTQVGSSVWSKVAASGSVLAIRTNGTLWAWGDGGNGRLGNNSTTPRSSPVQVGALTNWSQVFGSGVCCHAIKTDGTLWAWGGNNYGGIGDNTAIARSSPVQVGSNTNWGFISPGHRFVYALKTDGTLWVFGGSSSGNGISSPVQIGTDTTWNEISSGNQYLIIGA